MSHDLQSLSADEWVKARAEYEAESKRRAEFSYSDAVAKFKTESENLDVMDKAELQELRQNQKERRKEVLNPLRDAIRRDAATLGIDVPGSKSNPIERYQVIKKNDTWVWLVGETEYASVKMDTSVTPEHLRTALVSDYYNKREADGKEPLSSGMKSKYETRVLKLVAEQLG